MANINLKCPSCNQEMVCDDAYAGQDVLCPGCQKPLTVPGKDAGGGTLVLKPPSEGKSKLAIGTAQTHGKGAAAQPSHPSNLNTRKTNSGPKKPGRVMEILRYVLILGILGGGGYAAYKTFFKDSDEGGAPPVAKGKAAGKDAAAPADGSADPNAAAPAPEPPKPAPMVAPVWTLDINGVKISDGAVNGTITGTNFVAETVRVDLTPQSQVIRFIQGNPVSPDRELLVYLKLKPTDILNAQTIVVSNEMRGASVPQVAKRWKTNPKYAPQTKSFSYGYAMRLELAAATNDAVAGKIFVSLPDKEETVVAGSFKLTAKSVDPAQAAAAGAVGQPAPVQQGASPADRANFNRRYGLKR